jgi:hypothetical protein
MSDLEAVNEDDATDRAVDEPVAAASYSSGVVVTC